MKARSAPLKVLAAKYLKGYSLRIAFSDGSEQVVDFSTFLTMSQHPAIRRFIDKRKFRRFTIQDGELMWGDYDLIFPIIDLYENCLDRRSLTSPHGASSSSMSSRK